jgi:hypothetical protein
MLSEGRAEKELLQEDEVFSRQISLLLTLYSCMSTPLACFTFSNVISSERPTACFTGGWREQGPETETYRSTEQAPENAHSPSRPIHAMLGGFFYLTLEPANN